MALKKVYEAERALRDAMIAIPENHPLMGRVVGECNCVGKLRRALQNHLR